MRSLWYGIRQRLCRWCDGCWYIVAILLLFNQHFFDSRVVLKTFLWGIMVAATVDMVASAHVIREQDLCLLVNISGKTGFHAAFWASDLATCLVSLKMESVFTHGPLILLWLHSALLHFEKIARYLDKMKVQ